jgi:S-adenosylmethionine:tRNA ribosyltransferase-isomerase
MRLADFDYSLPPELIAQHPAPRREDARLMVVSRRDRRIEHTRVGELPRFLAPDDLVVLNDTRVFPARLFARREGKPELIEALLLAELSPGIWEALLKPGRKAPPGTRLLFGPGLSAEVLAMERQSMTRRLRFDCEGDFWAAIERFGKTPLPPYIQRDPATESPEDRERYQTVFARIPGSVAAPTAGLHFTTEMLGILRHVKVTLHVGYGTFQPVKVDQVEDHHMHAEYYRLPAESASAIQGQLEAGRRVVAVGTTTTRVLEHVCRKCGRIEASDGWTDIFIYPGYTFQVIGGLLTNFHLPKSTLLLLVSAFAGVELVRRCYEEAVRQRYRFYSYGDAMLIV